MTKKRKKHMDEELDELLKRIRLLKQKANSILNPPDKKQSSGEPNNKEQMSNPSNEIQ